MARKAEVIAPEFFDIHGYVGDRLGTIDKEPAIMLPAQCRYLLHRCDRTKDIRSVAYCHEFC